MTREQLEHAIRAACGVAKDTELYVFGSQAILGEHPDAPPALRASIEVDIQPRNRLDAVDEIDGVLGELSTFHQTHGFYVHGVSIESARLPEGWESRTIAVRTPATFGNTGYCLESHDLAASKLAAFREKDRQFVTVLLAEGLIDGETLLQRLSTLPVGAEEIQRLSRWVNSTVRDLAG